MKILVIGLDGITSDRFFSDARLENLRRLMEYGCYGKLSYEGTSDRLGMWISFGTSQELGRLDEAGDAELGVIQGKAIWKYIEEQNKDVIVLGLPPFISYPREIETRIAKSLLDLRSLGEKMAIQEADRLKDHIYTVSQKQLDLVRLLMQSEEWDYFQFIDDGLHQLQRSKLSNSESDGQELLEEYYLYLDEQLGTILELLDDNTVVLVVSMRATEPFDGSFILVSINNPLTGEVEGANLLDIAPTLLELGGYELPDAMQGNSLVAGKTQQTGSDIDLTAEEEDILREQLSGLGYL